MQYIYGSGTFSSGNVWKTFNSALRAIKQSSILLNRAGMHLTFFLKKTIVPMPRAAIYRDRNDQKKMTRDNEVHKFSDGTFTRVLEKLDHMVKNSGCSSIIRAWIIESGPRMIKGGVKSL
nr:hypothetical protein [Tanacetum cinerariifolium]